MMSRISKESLPGGRNAAGGPQHVRRGRGLAAGGGLRDGDESLDLFARIRRYPLISSTIESSSQNATGLLKTSIGSAMLAKGGADDLLSADIGKTDYDWLLTPPGTPLFPSLDASEHQPSSAPRSSSNVRSVSATKASRFSVSQSENGQSTRPTRSSSVTRPSISSTNSSSYFSSNNSTSLLNTSTVSVTSRPTTPGKRPTRASSASASRLVPSRPSTPNKTRTSSSSSGDKPRQLQNSRPSTPTGRPHVPTTNSNSSSSTSAAHSNSRPSTPTRRNPAPAPAPTTPSRRTPPMVAPAPAMARSSSVGRTPTTNSRNLAPGSRPSSPGPRTRVHSAQPLALPDIPHNVHANLRTKLPERHSSANKQRPGVSLTAQAKPNSAAAAAPMSLNRGRLADNSTKEQSRSNGQDISLSEIQKSTVARRPNKPASSIESTGFGRTISKKSLDMALRHMDIRQGMGGIRGASLFPQSIRSPTSRGLPVRAVDKAATHDDERMSDSTSREDGNHNGMISSDSNLAISEDGEGMVSSAERESDVARVNKLDIYESSRYDTILLKEDSKNLSWLHSIEDTSNQSPVFDHRFEPLPELFSLI